MRIEFLGWQGTANCDRCGAMARKLRVAYEGAQMLGRWVGMNRRDIGEYLGMGTGAAVCRQLRVLRERIEGDRELAEAAWRITATLEIQRKRTGS